VENAEKTPEAQKVEAAEAEELEDEESENLPFPNARVVRIIKTNLKNPHQIKYDVKVAANELLGDILTDISQRMNDEEYFTLSIEHFNKASRKYREIGLQQKRINRIKKILEKQRAELDEIIAEIEVDLPENHSTSR
jgi:N-methylhydantoinase B/oxoprolinase/acetone carboxylase alpha subunit